MLQQLKKIVLPALLLLAVVVVLVKPGVEDFGSTTKKIQRKISDAEITFALAEQGDASKLPYRLYRFINDSLAYWSSNDVVPPVQVLPEGTSFQKLKNGWYVCFKSTNKTTGEVRVGLLLVKHTYPVQNRFLQNTFDFDFAVPDNVELTDQKISGSAVILNSKNEPLFYLYVSGNEKEKSINYWMLAAQLLLLVFVIYYLYILALSISNRVNVFAGWGFLAAGLIAIRAVMLYFALPDELLKLPLFSPNYYASSAITPSLGDLLLNCAVLYAINRYITARASVQSSISKILLLGLSLTTLFVFTGLILFIFKTLVIDSVISFEVYNVLSLDAFSLLGLCCIALLILTHFQLSRFIFQVLISNGFSAKTLFWGVALFVALGITAALLSEILLSALFTSLWMAVYSYFLYRFVAGKSPLTLRHIVLFVALYSFCTTFLIENLYEKKERQQRRRFADKLVAERDFVAEYLFKDVAHNVSRDVLAKNYLSNPFIYKRELADRINSLYLSGYYNKYDIEYHFFDASGHAIRNSDSSSLQDFMRQFRFTGWQPDTLYYLSDTTQNYRYLSVVTSKSDTSVAGYIALVLNPKTYYGQNVYPELLLGSNIVTHDNQFNYSYAIYLGDKLIAQYGEFPYTYYWDDKYNFGKLEHLFIEEWDWEHGITQFANNKRIIVSVEREPFFEPIATFSYLFSFYFLMALLVLLLQRALFKDNTGAELLNDFSLSFRTRINYSMLAMIVVSFIVIGLTTIRFFTRQYDNFYNDRLNRKEKVIHASLEYFIQQNIIFSGSLFTTESGNALSYEVARLAEINDIDINLFDMQGRLSVSSQPSIYDKGIVSKLMNPVAFRSLQSKGVPQFTQHESIGKLDYLATYSPVRSNNGTAIAYLGIPYFEKTRDINEEVSTFLIALMNVYVFLLLCAATMAFFISNSITRPLTIISDKLRILNLSKRNEPIEWNSKDEIGVLVGEYNKMIHELEQGAQKLAKSERESAWREMAKQIAHEIKNPLTPMKLSIQYLQKAIDEGNPNIEQLAKRVTQTLNEQIENLSSIATAFASFAKMPKAENEIINLNDLLRSVVELFGKEENTQISFETNTTAATVFADKNQLVSVFNNLVKNGMQSVPESKKGYVDVRVTEQDGWITVSVQDNGTGISADNYERVFVPNFTTKSSGTGLGLAITKQIIDGAGGTIWFESEVGSGTTFFVRLKKVAG